MLWQDGSEIQRVLEASFNQILQTRMQGLPMVNPKLMVRALGFGKISQDWLGVLITPWCMNLLLIPDKDSDWQEKQPGIKFERKFPYGDFEFTVANESGLGIYAQCSLFSPMFQFADQDAAVTAAKAALHTLLSGSSAPNISRRDLLRGNLGHH